MAFQTLEYVGSNSGSVSNSGSPAAISVSLTALTGGSGAAALEGDIVIAIVGDCSSTNVNTGVATAGYTELCNLYVSDSFDSNLIVEWKIMGATPDTTVLTDVGGTTDFASTCVVHVWRNVDQTTPIDATTTTATGGNTGDVNPPSITPVTTNAVVIACGTSGNSGGASITYSSIPGLSNTAQLQGEGPTIRDCLVGVGSVAWTSGAVDPSAWTITSDSTSWSYAAASIALRPAKIPNAVKSINGVSNV